MIKPFASEKTRTSKKSKISDANNEGDNDEDNAVDDEDVDDDDVDDNDIDDEEDDENEAEYDVDPDREAADDADIEAIIKAVEEEYNSTPEEQRLGRTAVTKLKKLAKRIFHSPTLREDLAVSCEKASITPKEMVRSVDTRWNSLAQAIERTVYLKDAIEKLLQMAKHNKNGPEGLKRFKLGVEEWKILTQLLPLLKLFLRCTEYISKMSTPLLHDVIPIIDELTTRLEAAVANATLVRPVRAAAARGLEMLNQYYEKTDESIMYRMAMMLHPKHKKSYFVRQKWEPEWIVEAERLLREQWENHYKSQSSTSTDETPVTQDSVFDDDDDFFSAIQNFGSGDDSSDALTTYLSTAPLPKVDDPIMYWTSQLNGGDPMAQMALDFLSAPASSVDVERAFSRGSLTVTKRRHALSDESVRAATVLSSWASVPGLVPEVQLVDGFRAKGKNSLTTDTANVYKDTAE